jgi:UrcA family protein
MTIRKMSASCSIATAAALALSAAPSSPASAKEVTVLRQLPDEDQLTQRVSYADLDLASASDVQRLTFRVRGAVSRVCAPLDQRGTFAKHSDCTTYAWHGARPQMDRAIARAQQIASTGTSAIAPVAILIAAPQD